MSLFFKATRLPDNKVNLQYCNFMILLIINQQQSLLN